MLLSLWIYCEDNVINGQIAVRKGGNEGGWKRPEVSFHILPDGRVTNLRLTSNTGNAALAKVALETVRRTRLSCARNQMADTRRDHVLCMRW